MLKLLWLNVVKHQNFQLRPYMNTFTELPRHKFLINKTMDQIHVANQII